MGLHETFVGLRNHVTRPMHRDYAAGSPGQRVRVKIEERSPGKPDCMSDEALNSTKRFPYHFINMFSRHHSPTGRHHCQLIRHHCQLIRRRRRNTSASFTNLMGFRFYFQMGFAIILGFQGFRIWIRFQV